MAVFWKLLWSSLIFGVASELQGSIGDADAPFDQPDSEDLIWASHGITLVRLGNESYESPLVRIEDGVVRGTVNKTVGEKKTYYAFRGIPYAQPPLGDLRFAPPVKNSNWSGILNATNDKSECTQGSDPVTGSEDCLYINVYVPKLRKRNLTVMVWIYGGAFVSGNSSYAYYGPDYLLDQDIIYVSFNYRLGAFGFFSTGDLACPGNWGLKDQILALKWVKRNIARFTGNPNNITVFGESAGSVSVSLLLQTNASKGLINAAIMQSGTSLNLWGRNVRASRVAFETGVALGIITTNSTELIEGLRETDYETLQTISTTVGDAILLENALEGLAFSPVIEPVHDGAAFVNASQELLTQGGMHRVPQMIGYNSNEAAAVGDIPAILKVYLANYDISVSYLTPHNLTTNVIYELLVGLNIKSHYFGILPIALQSTDVVTFASEDQFNRPIREAANLTSLYTDVFFYVFAHEGILSGVTDRNFTGVGHAEDLKYIFRSSNNFTESDVLTRTRIVKLWTNFAKFCNPTPFQDSLFQNLTWPKLNITSGNHTYLNINTTLSIEQNPDQEGWEYYQGIWGEYGEPPFDTY